MNYNEIIRRVRRLDFIRNDEKAAAAVKTVLGVVAGRLSEEQARKLAEKFPEQFFGGSPEIEPVKPAAFSVKECNDSICSQFKLSVHQGRTLIRTVLYFTKEASGDTFIMDIKKSLPSDWAEAMEKA